MFLTYLATFSYREICMKVLSRAIANNPNKFIEIALLQVHSQDTLIGELAEPKINEHES